MAIGNPLLAVWDVDGVIRTYEYSSNRFVLIGSRGGISHSPSSAALEAGANPAPHLVWDWEDAYLVAISSTTSNFTARTFTPLLTLVDSSSLFATTPNLGGGHVASNRPPHQHWVKPSYTTHRVMMNVASDGKISTGTIQTASAFGQDVADLEVSPDGLNMLVTPVDATLRSARWSTRLNPANTSWTNRGIPPFTSNSQIVKFAHNNRSVLVCDTIFNVASIWVLDQGTWTQLHTIDAPAGQIKQASMSPDTRTMAISSLDGDTWRTRIYVRVGDYFQPKQDITGVGELLDFTEDGVMLIDSALRRAFILSGDIYVAHDEAMINLPSLVKAQAVSRGLVYQYGQAQLYDGAVSALATNTVDIYNVKFTLLKSTAVFNAADLTATAAIGAHEVNTGMWPAGGVQLENIIGLENPPFYDFTADPINKLVVGTTLFTRYGLIYDATFDIPLIFIDFMNNRSVIKNRELVINFRDGAFLRYSK